DLVDNLDDHGRNQRFQDGGELEQRIAPAVGDVEFLAERLVLEQRPDQAVGNVFDVREVECQPAAAVQLERLAGQGVLDEDLADAPVDVVRAIDGGRTHDRIRHVEAA